MFWMTEDATVVCDHQPGNVSGFAPAQSWVTVARRRVLIRPDPVGRPIKGCPGVPPIQKQCTSTLTVTKGYSKLITIDGSPVCLDSLVGLTDSPGMHFRCRAPAQELVGTDT